MSQEVFNINNVDELKSVALAVEKLCKTHSIFRVDGEMGAGKTTLISLICRTLQITDNPSSPTYSIVNNYFSETHGEINHFDFYRIEHENEAIDSGLDELLYNGSICFIEWAEKIEGLMPEDCATINIEIESNNQRIITLTL